MRRVVRASAPLDRPHVEAHRIEITPARIFKTQSMVSWPRKPERAARAVGFGKGEFLFHDIKTKSVSDSPDEIDAMNRGAHTSIRPTRRVYRRKPIDVISLPRTSRKAG